MNTLSGFANFAKQGKNIINNGGTKVAIVYTRVSSKEQLILIYPWIFSEKLLRNMH